MKALVVDGYNAIYKIKQLRPLLDTNLREARQALTRLAIDYQRKTGGIARTYVVFDGKDAYRDLPAPSHQIFSKTGEGDREIIRTIRKLSKDYHVVVASDDNFVRNNSRAYNATAITISEFAAAMEKKGAGTRRDIGEDKRISPESAREITAYLRKRLG